MFGKKSKTAKSGVDLAKNGPDGADDLGRFPAEVDSNPSRARSTEKALRSMALGLTVSGMMNIALIMLVITLFPLQKVFPYLVTFKSQDNQVVQIEPMALDAPGMLFATEDNIRDYVVQRHTFVPIEDTMKQRWGGASRLAARTDPELYARFASAATDETKQMLGAGYARTIDINSVQRIGGDTWQVNFTTHDSLPTSAGTLTGASAFGNQPSTVGTPGNPTLPTIAQVQDQNWITTLRVTYRPQNVTYDKRLLNPLGFTVTDYSVSRTTAARN